MSEISKVKLQGQAYNIKDATARASIAVIEQTLSSALIFKGVVSQASDITSLTNYKIGWCYKSSASFTFGTEQVSPGDMFICVSDYNTSFKYTDWTVLEETLEDMVGATSTTDGAHGLVPKPVAGDQNKYLKGDGTWGEVNSAVWGNITGDISDQTDLQTALAAKAELDSPALTGTPTSPTAASDANNTQIANTSWVKAKIADYSPEYQPDPSGDTGTLIFGLNQVTSEGTLVI